MLKVDSFLDRVVVKRELEYDTCEYEVTLSAMKSYLKYDCYKEWEPVLHGNSIGNYLRNRTPKHWKEFRGNGNYRGAYLLKEKNGDKVLTADILTSKSVPFNQCLANLSVGQWKECEPYYKAFEIVNYWCGNMIPTICSFSPGRGDYSSLDNWKMKLNLLFSISENKIDEYEKKMYHDFMKGVGKCYKQNQIWPGWMFFHWNNDIDYFISSNYLCDYVKNGETLRFVKDIDDFDFASILKFSKRQNDIEEIKRWFLINTKLIIQRSYRIFYSVKNVFNEEQKGFIITVFERIFLKAQIPEDEWELEII